MGKHEPEDDYNLQELLESEQDPEKKKVLEFFNDIVLTKNAKKKRVLEELEQIDAKVRTALSLVLNYYSSEHAFNQQLLEDVAVLVIKRSKIVKKIK